ncbi:response regulator [Paenibacillus sp. NPDC056933]|uniref:response regulator n=1 Tax=Paenibacillus sp. NPDC056933 TaxID=3345968 RepID=UPI00362A7DB5
MMLVDDEILIRESIRECVHWEKEGFIYCGDAPDGELALPIVMEQRPDILITDIKMPFMNGLELSAAVLQRFPDIKIIILSGHDDFHYAQSAMRLGVADYCLKPVSSADLLQILHSVSNRMDEEQHLKRKYACTPEKLYADLCGGLITAAAALDTAAQLGLPLTAPCYTVAIVELVHQDTSSNSSLYPSPDEADLLLHGLLAGLSEVLSYKRSRTEAVLIFRAHSPDGMSSTLEQACDRMKHKSGMTGLEWSIHVGKSKERLQDIHLSYLEAEHERINTKMMNSKQASFLEDSFDTSASILLDRNRLVEFLKLGNSGELPDFLDKFVADLDKMNWHSMYTYYVVHNISLELVHAGKQYFHPEENEQLFLQKLQAQIGLISGTRDCLNYLNKLYEALWQWRSGKLDKYRELIELTKQLIREHYDDEQLSLQDLSRKAGVSPSHLSKIFSQETGQTMNEFLTATRMGKAKELLRTTRCKTFEIAYQVGYNDQHYFSNLFKKVTGMTPMAYRKAAEMDEPVSSPPSRRKQV